MGYDQSNLAVGTVFQGRYRLESELGEGGFSTVYKACQLATGQDVAVKVLRWGGAGGASVEGQIARFQREAQLSGQLHHPNIVRLIDSGRAGDGIIYSVFELVPGKALRQVLAAEGALEPREARHLMLEVVDALSCAHANGVVHRDLKPGNIMVIATGARRNALVLDFGIGSLTAEARTEGWMSLTPTNESLGTPGYAAPEQLRGLPPSPRSDLFSWGLVFLECLTGTRVFAGSSLPAVLFELLGPEPVPIPAALRGHPLGDLLRRVTVKDVEARDISAAQVLRELEACDVRDLSRAALAGGGAGQEQPARADEGRPCAPVEAHLPARVEAAATALDEAATTPVVPSSELARTWSGGGTSVGARDSADTTLRSAVEGEGAAAPPRRVGHGGRGR